MQRQANRETDGTATRMGTGSLAEAKQILRGPKDRANAAPKLKTGSLAEAKAVMDQINVRDAVCDRLVRKSEVHRAERTLASLALPIGRR